MKDKTTWDDKQYVQYEQSLLTKTGNKKKVIIAMSLNKTEALNFILTYIEKRRLKTMIDRQYPLKELHEANTYVEEGHKKGNVVIKVE